MFKKSLGEIIQKYKALLSKPFEVHDETDRPAVNRLPFVHSDPDLVGFLPFKAGCNHDPLNLVEILPLLQLPGP
ncbi:MAG: hypothetical protein R6T98_04755 [Desulfatiglandales bacterium]